MTAERSPWAHSTGQAPVGEKKGKGVVFTGRTPVPLSSQLFKLDLQGTKVTDAGLGPLTGLTQLHCLNVADTPVTLAGLAELQKALPKCQIMGIKRDRFGE